MTQTSTSSVTEPSISRIFATVLALVFVVEFGVMFLLLPALLPADTPGHLEALVDASLLTVGLVPLLWIAIVRPLRQAALGERARAAAVVRTATDGILTMDRGTIIQTANPAVQDILGWPEKDLIGQPISILFADVFDSAAGPLPNTDEFDAGRGAVGPPEIEMTGMRPDGVRVPLTVSLSGFHYGEQRYLAAIIHDMTERMAGEAQLAARAKQQSVVAGLGHRALAGGDFDELLSLVATRAAITLEAENCLIIEMLDDSIVVKAAFRSAQWHSAGTSTEMTVCDRSLLASPIRTQHVAAMADSSPFFDHLRSQKTESVTSCVIEGGTETFGVLLLCHSESTKHSTIDLDFLRSLSNVIGAALQRARAESELREKERVRAGQMALVAQVATGVAHEIRNPLTSIKMICQTLAEEAAGANQAADLAVVIDEVLRMERSLSVFLDYARPPQAEMGRVDLTAVVDRTVTLSGKKCEAQHVHLSFECDERPLVIWGDSAKLQQLLLNLSLNSLAAMPHGGQLEISARRNAGCIRVIVCDSGPGVPTELRERIFDPFFTTKETGVGLGLVICRQISVDHDGTLELEPTDSGAKFVLTLPLFAQASGVASE